MADRKLKKLSKGLFSFAILAILLSLPLDAIGYLAVKEHQRRENVLAHGNLATATIAEAKWIGRGCAFSYIFVFRDKAYKGGEGGCRLVQTHPVGSSVSVRFFPSDPENSIAVGADRWPAWGIIPVLLALPLLLLGAVVFAAIVAEAFKAPSRKKRVRRATSV